MGAHFLPDPDRGIVYWYFQGLITTEQSLAEQARAVSLGDFSDWRAELVYLEPETEFPMELYHGFPAMRPLLREMIPRMPKACAVVCTPLQMTSMPGFWQTVMANAPDLHRTYEIFSDLPRAMEWLQVPLDAAVEALARLRIVALEGNRP